MNNNLDDDAIQIAAEAEGSRGARVIFELGGNKHSICLTEKRLASCIAVRFEAGAYCWLKQVHQIDHHIDHDAIRFEAEEEGQRAARATFELRGNKGSIHLIENKLLSYIVHSFEAGAKWARAWIPGGPSACDRREEPCLPESTGLLAARTERE